MVRMSDKKRYEIADGRIRAFYGHSVSQRLRKETAEPPALLYHGTAPEAVEAIRAGGLRPMSRQFVHLSADGETAAQVGRRKARSPVILEVDARAAHNVGVRFYLGNEMVWLADLVPPRIISIR